MVTLEEAAKIAEAKIPSNLRLCGEYGEAQGKYVFGTCRRSDGLVPPGGFDWTVDKETGKYEASYLEREFLAPYAPIRGYKKLGEIVEREYTKKFGRGE